MAEHREIIISRIADKLAAKAIWLENRGRVFPLLEASAKRLLIKKLDAGDSLDELDDPSNIDLDIITEWLSVAVKSNVDWLHVTHNGIPKYLTNIDTYENLVSVAKFTIGGYDPRLLGPGVIRSQDRIVANLADNFHLVELIADTSIEQELEHFSYKLVGSGESGDYKHHVYSLRDPSNNPVGIIEAVERSVSDSLNGLWFVDAKEIGGQPMSRKHWELVLKHYSRIKQYKFSQYATEKFPFIIDSYGEFHHIDDLPDQMHVGVFQIEHGPYEGKDTTNRLKVRLPSNLTNTHQLTLRGVDADKLPDTKNYCAWIDINNSHIDVAANGLKQTKMGRRIVGSRISLNNVSFGKAPSEMIADDIKIWDCTNAFADVIQATMLETNVPLPDRSVKIEVDDFRYEIGPDRVVNTGIVHKIDVIEMAADVGNVSRLPRGITCDELCVFEKHARPEGDLDTREKPRKEIELVFGDNITVNHLLALPVNESTDISKINFGRSAKVLDGPIGKTSGLRMFKLKLFFRKFYGFNKGQVD